jgi:hypothetical protein
MNKVFFRIIIFLLCVSLLFSDDYINIEIKPIYQAAIKNNLFLMAGNMDVCTIGKNEYLISVGLCDVSGNNPGDILNAKTVAVVMARQQMGEFIYNVKLSRFTLIRTVSNKTKISSRNAQGKVAIQAVKKMDKYFKDTIIQETSFHIQGTDIVGYWQSLDRKFMYAAVAFKFSKKRKK